LTHNLLDVSEEWDWIIFYVQWHYFKSPKGPKRQNLSSLFSTEDQTGKCFQKVLHENPNTLDDIKHDYVYTKLFWRNCFTLPWEDAN